MPVVFVHGVNNREGREYRASRNARDALLKRLTLPALVPDPEKVQILTPYWGRYGAKFAWEHASFPERDIEAFGAEEPDLADDLLNEVLGDDTAAGKQPLLEVARRHSLEEAIDLAWALAGEDAEDAEAGRLAESAAKALAYAYKHPAPPWLKTVRTDAQLLDRLQREVQSARAERVGRAERSANAESEAEFEAFGRTLWDRIGEGAGRLKDAAGRLLGSGTARAFRFKLHEQAGLFLGDVFVYLQKRGTPAAPGKIVQEVGRTLIRADAARTNADPKLLVIAHSMGGNIVYDLLTHYAKKIHVDVFVTVGSQVGLFEELKLFNISSSRLPGPGQPLVPRPANIGCWLNILDHNDCFAFAVEGIFADTTDYAYSTGKGLVYAHPSYFIRPSFYQRLGERIRAKCS
jgi:hypothetical protein